MYHLFKFSILFIIIGSLHSYSQRSAIYTNDLTDFNTALQLYSKKQYQAAQIIFDKTKASVSDQEIQSDCAYYTAICALRLEKANTSDLIASFIVNYPSSTKQNQALLELAYFYFDQAKYPSALEWFNKVDQFYISNIDKIKYNFQKGYCFFHAEKWEEAKPFFKQVEHSNEYGTQAKYYLGFIAYEKNQYEEATNYFNQVKDQEKYKSKMGYFQSDMAFKSGHFQKAIDLGLAQIKESDLGDKSELSKIIGESYFNLKEYNKAIPYLVDYKGKEGKWNNTDYYMLGYAHYKQDDFENAITQFNKIIDGNDTVAQNAYYHLGESYLKTHKKQQALNAFKNASEMEFESNIKEDAYLNYAKLSYDIGNPYQAVSQVLIDYLATYPQSKNRDDIEKFLVNSYITSKNYNEALLILEKNKNANIKGVYQKVTFYRGIELFNDGKYQDALVLFKNSLSQPYDNQFTTRAHFWKAETEYVLTNFEEALLSYKQFAGSGQAKKTPEYENIDYNIGYTYFKLKQYEKATTYFQAYVEQPKEDKIRLNDAYLRLGDSYFVTTKYWPAMEAYNKAIGMKGIDADYALFQKAISYGFVARNDRKIDDLTQFIKNYPKSSLQDDALFELGNTYVAEKKTTQALETYDFLIKEYPESSYISRAILRQGLVYYNDENDKEALTKFKKVVDNYPHTAEAIEAVSVSRLIYIDQGKVDEYGTWVKKLGFIEVSDADIDNTTFESAEKQFLQGNIPHAIAGLSGYISKFPNGINLLKANFYLAQCYFSEKLEIKAIPNYEFVISKPKNEFTEQALVRLSDIYSTKNDYINAIPILSRLEKEADFPQNITFAQSNLMRFYYEQENFEEAVIYADKILANAKVDDKIKSDAQIIVARAAIKTGNLFKAKAAYAKLETIAKGELAAEALYYNAYFKNKEGAFEASNVVIQELSREYPSYRYFGAKGLILMAKNFEGLQDAFQANYILENVINNFEEYPDVIEEAEQTLDILKTQQAKSNSSIKK